MVSRGNKALHKRHWGRGNLNSICVCSTEGMAQKRHWEKILWEVTGILGEEGAANWATELCIPSRSIHLVRDVACSPESKEIKSFTQFSWLHCRYIWSFYSAYKRHLLLFPHMGFVKTQKSWAQGNYSREASRPFRVLKFNSVEVPKVYSR